MADFYKVLKADPLGDPWTPNAPDAKPIQNYWCQVEGQDLPVSIGKQVGNTVTPGTHVYGDLMFAKSQKGTQYWKFKSQKVPEGVQRPADSPAQATAQAATQTPLPNMSATGMPEWFMPVANQIDYIFREMKKMDADAPQETAPAPDEPKGVEHYAGDPVDKETQAKLDDIFGPEPEV
jgi:hypothetical protein